MIFLNFDFIDQELTTNTIHYLKAEPKQQLLDEAGQWDFNGVGFKNRTKLKAYICQQGHLNEKELLKKTSSTSRRTSEETIKRLETLFVKEAPLAMDTEKIYRMMLLSSNLMFTPNEKIFFTIMLDDPTVQWSAKALVEEAQKYYELKLSVKKMEESLRRHLVPNPKTAALLCSEVKEESELYQIHLTNFIQYIRYFEQ